MYLESLQIQGFKSFAQRTFLKFSLPDENSRGVTAIVGPNGSGKSNCVDAFRWVMGEQSIKTLRGKKMEDIIFAGSNKKQRCGFAEVSLVLKNEDDDQPPPQSSPSRQEEEEPLDQRSSGTGEWGKEIEITRRVYRDGASEYLLGKNRVRLSDIQLLLARLGVGAETYSIIGQGMIDSILTMNEVEKKEFFDEATGIKQYQLKKNQSLLQLKNASANMREALAIIQEIEPHLKYLKRQVHRLEEKTKIEEELHALQHIYYSALYHELAEKIGAGKNRLKKIEDSAEKEKRELAELAQKSEKTIHFDTQSPIAKLQEIYQSLLEEKNEIVEKELQMKNKIWQLKQRVQKTQTRPINPPHILSKIEKIEKLEEEVILLMREKTFDIKFAAQKLEEALAETRELSRALKINDDAAGIGAKKEEKELAELKSRLENLGKNIEQTKKQMEEAYKKEEEDKRDFVEIQKKIQFKQENLRLLENQLNELRIELARLETRQETLEKEMRDELKERVEKVKKEKIVPEESIETILQKTQKLKYQLVLAGGVDEQVVKEYNETNERYDFLKNQTDDLKKSIANLTGVIEKLDEIMEKQFNQSFYKINDAFNKYFKILFGGGNASLIKKEMSGATKKQKNIETEEQENAEQKDDVSEILSEQKYLIEINAAPPGKKIKGIQMLSGGERALTAIALICGIINCNPSPFIILDEVDAAFDEINSIKFAAILKELSRQSQFIIITHNRATMENSSLLYGVTMSDDGVSKILSVNLRAAGELVD